MTELHQFVCILQYFVCVLSKKRTRPISQAIDLRAPLEDENDNDKLLLITNSNIAPEPSTEQRDLDLDASEMLY